MGGFIVAWANRKRPWHRLPLNLHLFVTLIGSGSRNVFELAPRGTGADGEPAGDGIDADGY